MADTGNVARDSGRPEADVLLGPCLKVLQCKMHHIQYTDMSFKTTTWTFVCYPLITVTVAGDFDHYSTFVLNREMLDEVKADRRGRKREREK